MNSKIWGIIGGLALVLALLSPYLLGSSKKVAQLFEAAEMLYEENDYEGAIAKYEEALKESNKLRAKTEAIDEDFQTLVNLRITTSYVNLAEHENNLNYYEKALEHVEKAAQTVSLAEYEEELTYLWGYIFYKTDQLEQAVEKLTQLIENFPNSSFVEKAQETIADIKQQNQAEKITQQPDSVPAWINDLSKFEAFNKKKNRILVVANRFRAEKQYAKAAEQYEVFANTTSSTTEVVYALYWSGWCYCEDSFNDEASLSKAISLFQKLIDNYNDSRYTSEAQEKAKSGSAEAIITAEEAVHRVQQLGCKSVLIPQTITHLHKAKRKQEQDNYEAAYQSAKKTSDIAKRAINNHETAVMRVDQGYNYLRRGQLETATKHAREAHRIHPSYQNANNLLKEIKQEYLNQGINYIKAKEYAKAIPHLKKAIDIDPCKEAFYNLGVAYLQSGDFENAKAACQDALAIDPTYKEAQDLCDSIAD